MCFLTLGFICILLFQYVIILIKYKIFYYIGNLIFLPSSDGEVNDTLFTLWLFMSSEISGDGWIRKSPNMWFFLGSKMAAWSGPQALGAPCLACILLLLLSAQPLWTSCLNTHYLKTLICKTEVTFQSSINKIRMCFVIRFNEIR